MSTSHQVDYDPTKTVNEHPGWANYDDPSTIASIIMLQKVLPKNFIFFSEASKAFRQAVLAELLYMANTEEEKERLIELFCEYVSGSAPESANLKVFSEYAASIAFALEQKPLAVKIITRNKPEQTPSSLWTLISAIKKGMPGIMYQGLLLSNKETATSEWNDTKRLVIPQ